MHKATIRVTVEPSPTGHAGSAKISCTFNPPITHDDLTTNQAAEIALRMLQAVKGSVDDE